MFGEEGRSIRRANNKSTYTQTAARLHRGTEISPTYRGTEISPTYRDIADIRGNGDIADAQRNRETEKQKGTETQRSIFGIPRGEYRGLSELQGLRHCHILHYIAIYACRAIYDNMCSPRQDARVLRFITVAPPLGSEFPRGQQRGGTDGADSRLRLRRIALVESCDEIWSIGQEF